MSSPLLNAFWNLIRPQNWHIEENCNYYGNFQVLVRDIIKMHPPSPPAPPRTGELLLSCSVVSNSATPWTVACQGTSVHGVSPGKHTGVGCHVLLHGIIPSQGWNPGLSPCRRVLYQLSHQGGRSGDPLTWCSVTSPSLALCSLWIALCYNCVQPLVSASLVAQW